jgi:hypothetical protein
MRVVVYFSWKCNSLRSNTHFRRKIYNHPPHVRAIPICEEKNLKAKKPGFILLPAYLCSQMGRMWGVFSVRENMSERSELFSQKKRHPTSSTLHPITTGYRSLYQNI